MIKSLRLFVFCVLFCVSFSCSSQRKFHSSFVRGSIIFTDIHHVNYIRICNVNINPEGAFLVFYEEDWRDIGYQLNESGILHFTYLDKAAEIKVEFFIASGIYYINKENSISLIKKVVTCDKSDELIKILSDKSFHSAEGDYVIYDQLKSAIQILGGDCAMQGHR